MIGGWPNSCGQRRSHVYPPTMRKSDKNADEFAARIASAVVHRLTASQAFTEPRVMERVGGFLKNLGSVINAVASSGLIAKGFRSTPQLEFYFDLHRGSEELAAVAKGWDDPGIRVLDLIWIRANAISRFRAVMDQVLDACSSQGVCFYIRNATQEGAEIELWTPLYGDTLNPKQLKRAVQALADCRRRIRRLCPFEVEPPAGTRRFEWN